MQDRPIIFVDAGGSEFPARAISFHRGEGFVAPGGHPALDLEVTLTPDAEAPEVIQQVRHESFVEGSSGHHWKYADEQATPATLAELYEEVKVAGYSDEAATKIAQDRFDGKYGDPARYLGMDEELEGKIEDQVASQDDGRGNSGAYAPGSMSATFPSPGATDPPSPEPDGQKTVDLGSQPPAAGTTAPKEKKGFLGKAVDKLRS